MIRPELEPMRPYSPGLRASEVRERSGKDVILKLSSNEHPCGPVPAAVAAMKAVSGHTNRYPDGSCRALKRRIGEHWGVEERFISVGSGSNELLRVLAQALLRPGDEVVFAWPSFIVYQMVCGLFDATAVKVPLDADQAHDIPAMLAAITDKTRIVFLCNPNNPTGTIYRQPDFDHYLAEVPDHVVTVVDEAYFEFVTDSAYPNGLKAFDGERPLVVARTFSKMYSLAGLRVGYAFAPEPLVEAMDKVREPFNVNMMAQIAAYYSLDDQDEVVRRRHENAAERVRLTKAFDRLGVRYAASQANFIYILTERPTDLFEALLSEGIIARDFGTSPALRLTLGTPEDNGIVIEAFEKVVAKLGTE
jgi:histidinol-phosphate aminotransferase